MTKTLLCDIDGCLANWNSKFKALLAGLHGPRGVDAEAMTSWHWPRALGYSNKEIDAAWDKADHDWWQEIKPYATAAEALELLSNFTDYNKDFQVYFVTGRWPHIQFVSIGWLETYGFFRPSVITTSRKAALAQVFQQDGRVAVIEDKPSLLSAYMLGNSCQHIYRIEQPYNLLNTPGNRGFKTVLGAVQDLGMQWQLETKTPQTKAEAETE